MSDLAQTVLEFVRIHPNWSAFVVFAMAFGESLPFVSLVFPFLAALVGIGAIASAADPLIFTTVVSAAAIGATLGDWLSYWIGYRYHDRIQRVGSLLLGLYDKEGLLHHVGFTSALADAEKPALTKRLEKLVAPPGFTGDAPGGLVAGAQRALPNGNRCARSWWSR